MNYVSTRGGSPRKSFEDVLLEGLAPDGGLYVPEDYPQIMNRDLLRTQSFIDVALYIFGLFADDIPTEEMQAILESTYTKEKFGDEQITPLHSLEQGVWLLKLSNGPTLAFKDVAMQLLGSLMERALSRRNEDLNILGATSGDTGSAAEYAMKGKKGIRVFMLSPQGRMSPFQQMQMYTLDDPNIFNLEVSGVFDDCQRVAKMVMGDDHFKRRYKLGAVNSFNWARIAAQVVYCVSAYLKVAPHNQTVRFAIPSGNFGNALSAYIARRMGLPIEIVVCTNENDVLDEFFRTGVYRVRAGNEVHATSSPSMDIAEASNFERFMFDWSGRDPVITRERWKQLKGAGVFDVKDTTPGRRFGITSGKATQDEVLRIIRLVHREYGVIIDPHTAVAMRVALWNYTSDMPVVVFETAQPAKFSGTIQEALKVEVPIPEAYKGLMDLPRKTFRIAPDPEAIKQFIVSHT